MDDRYFYLLDRAGLLSIWEGFPELEQAPVVQLRAQAGRLSSDGDALVLAGRELWVGSIENIIQGGSMRSVQLAGVETPNFSAYDVEIGHGALFVSDRNHAQVWVWHDREDALLGRPSDAILGTDRVSDDQPGNGSGALFWPWRLSYDGQYLWIGEYKFSSRLLRYSPGVTDRLTLRH